MHGVFHWRSSRFFEHVEIDATERAALVGGEVERAEVEGKAVDGSANNDLVRAVGGFTASSRDNVADAFVEDWLVGCDDDGLALGNRQVGIAGCCAAADDQPGGQKNRGSE